MERYLKTFPFFRVRKVLSCSVLLLGLVSPGWAQACGSEDLFWSDENKKIQIKGEEGVSCTLPDLKAFLDGQEVALEPEEPIQLVDETLGHWYLSVSIEITDGATLQLHGDDAGGDVNRVYFASSASGYHTIHANHGIIDIQHTQIFGWDIGADAPVDDGHVHSFEGGYHQYREGEIRSHIKARSKKNAESTMNIRHSEIAYLGSEENNVDGIYESYGLSWKSFQFDEFRDPDEPSDGDPVSGVVENSLIHHCYRGVYGDAISSSRFVGNTIRDNYDDGMHFREKVRDEIESNEVYVAGNTLENNVNDGFSCSSECSGFLIEDNVVGGNDVGVNISEGAVGGVIYQNQIVNNSSFGVNVKNSADVVIEDNVLDGNRRGIRIVSGSTELDVFLNDILGSSEYAVYVQGSEGGGPDERPSGNSIYQNNLASNNYGFFVQRSDSNDIYSNTLETAADAKFKFKYSQNNQA